MPIKHKKVKEIEAGIWLMDNSQYLVDFSPNGSQRRFRKLHNTKAEARQYKSWVVTNQAKNPDWKPKKKASKDNRHLSALIEAWYTCHGFSLDDGQRRKRKLEIMCDIMENPIARKIDRESLADYRPVRLAMKWQGKYIQPKTVNNEHGYLVSLFNTLIQLGKWKYGNNVAGIKKLKLDERELIYLETHQIATLITALKDCGYTKALLVTELCLSTGARWSEALNLHERHIKRGQVQYVNTKNGSTRWVEISHELEAKLREAGKESDGQHVFTQARCEKQFLAGIEAAGIDLPEGQLTHVLRHTFATTYLANGGDIKTLQTVLGHKNLTSTEIYLKVVSAMKAKVVQLNPLANVYKLELKTAPKKPVSKEAQSA